MVCVGGAIYLAVQDLKTQTLDNVPAATIVKSTDKGRTWTWDHSAPMFDNFKFTTVMFLDYGKDNVNSPDGYVYAYGLDYNWRDTFDADPDPVDLYLARVPANSIQSRSTWQFFTGTDGSGNPQWTSDVNARLATLHDDRRIYPNVISNRARDLSVISQAGVVYDKPLKDRKSVV